MKLEKPLRLRDLLEAVDYARSPDHAREALSGVFLERDGADLTATATDGHRLAHARLEGFPLPLPAGELLVLPKGLGELRKALHKRNRHCAPADVEELPSGVTLTSRGRKVDLVAPFGLEFPNWQQVVPAEGDGSLAVLEPEAAADATDALDDFASALSGLKFPGVRVASDSGLGLSVRFRYELKAGHLGGSFSCPAHRKGSGFQFHVNPGYLADALRAARRGGTVSLEVVDDASPVVLRGPGGMAVVMPVRPPA